MFCGECGTENPETNQFCRNCGQALRRKAPASPTVAAPPATPPVMGVQADAPVSATKQGRNWAGIAALLCGIISWFFLTPVFAVVGLIAGAVGLWLRWKQVRKPAFSALAGIILALGALMVTTLIP